MSLFRLIPPPFMIPRIMQAKPDTEIIRERIADFSPLIDAAMVAGCFSLLVAIVWSAGLIITARIKKGGSKCG